MTTVLGPCACSTCHVLVVWNGWEWQSRDGRRHVCRAKTLARSVSSGIIDAAGMSSDQFDTVRSTPAVGSSPMVGVVVSGG